MNKATIAIILVANSLLSAKLLAGQDVAADKDHNERHNDELLSFETVGPWSPRANVNADVAMVYPLDSRFSENVRSWRHHGYKVAAITAAAWGPYQDYLDGVFDGNDHWDEAQKYKDGSLALHGDMARITPYMSPGNAFGDYLATRIQQTLDEGAEAIYLIEPEYYADTGWSENFKRQWKEQFGEDWQPPDSTPDAQYRASELKYYLYHRTVSEIFEAVGKYADAHGRRIPCYVGTHSLINYAHWGVVSPWSSLVDVAADGYIAQVWTGTARTPNVYEGRRKERTFEVAFLEYGVMQNFARDSGRRVWFLNDPVEDDPNHDWEDYRANWESTLTASLLHAGVSRFEVMPFPDRVFNGKHRIRSFPATTPRGDLNSADVGIPKTYETELQAVISALGDMEQSEVRWEYSGTLGVGVLISDTMMFQRADPSPSDANLGSFYGLAMPLLKRGVPVEPVQIESACAPDVLSRYKLLLLTYEGQKPRAPKFHETLAKWIRDGGALVVVDDDRDPYNAVREWWNTPPYSFQTPRQHLFSELDIPDDGNTSFKVGDGVVVFARLSPAALTYRKDGADTIRELVRKAASAVKMQWRETNALVLRRGPYIIAAGLDESVPKAKPYVLHGHFIDLFNSNLPLLANVALTPGRRIVLRDLGATPASATPSVVAASCRIRNKYASADKFTFLADGIANTDAVILVRTKLKPIGVFAESKSLNREDYETHDDTLRLRFTNAAKPIPIEIDFKH